MGWKAACILLNEREPGYLGTLPTHHSQAAHDLADQLGLGSYRSLGLTDFDSGIYPEDGHFVIGAYDGAAIVASQDLIFGAVTGENARVLRGLLELFPAAELLVLELHSVVNYWAYAYYRAGELQRVRRQCRRRRAGREGRAAARGARLLRPVSGAEWSVHL